MDGSKLFLGGHTLMQPHSYILLPFTIYPPQEDGCTVGKQNQGSVYGIFHYTTLGRLTLFEFDSCRQFMWMVDVYPVAS